MRAPHRPGSGADLHRRSLLRAGTGVAAAALAGLLSGCGVRFVASPETTPTAQRGPDDDARDTVVADAERLLARAVAGASAQPALAAVVEACTAHLRAFGATVSATGAEGGTGSTGSTSPAPTPTTGGGDPQSVADELAAASGRALSAAQTAGGPLARLVVAVAASRAVLLDGLAAAAAVTAPPVLRPASATATSSTPTSTTTTTPTPTGPVPGPGTSTSPRPSASGGTSTASSRVAALQRALAGEHAAVFAYGLVAGRVGEARLAEAYADLDAHRVARDDLTATLAALGAAPRTALAGYDAAAPTPEAAALLAASVEDHLAGAYADVVAAAAADRPVAADGVLRAARAAHRWGSVTTSFPGIAELAEDGEPVATTTPTAEPGATPAAT